MWWVEENLLFVEQKAPLRRAASPICFGRHTVYMGAHSVYGVARSFYAGPPALIFGGTTSFTTVSEEQSPTMLCERDTRGGTYRDFSTPLETRIQKETCRESRQVSYTPYGIR